MKGRKGSISQNFNNFFNKFKKSENPNTQIQEESKSSTLDIFPLCLVEGVVSDETTSQTVTSQENLAKSLAFLKIVTALFKKTFHDLYNSNMNISEDHYLCGMLDNLERIFIETKKYNFTNDKNNDKNDNDIRTTIRTLAVNSYQVFIDFIKNNSDNNKIEPELIRLLKTISNQINKAELISFPFFMQYITEPIEQFIGYDFNPLSGKNGNPFVKKTDDHVRFPGLSGAFGMYEQYLDGQEKEKFSAHQFIASGLEATSSKKIPAGFGMKYFYEHISNHFLNKILLKFITEKPEPKEKTLSSEDNVSEEQNLILNMLYEKYPICHFYYVHNNFVLPRTGKRLENFLKFSSNNDPAGFQVFVNMCLGKRINLNSSIKGYENEIAQACLAIDAVRNQTAEKHKAAETKIRTAAKEQWNSITKTLESRCPASWLYCTQKSKFPSSAEELKSFWQKQMDELKKLQNNIEKQPAFLAQQQAKNLGTDYNAADDFNADFSLAMQIKINQFAEQENKSEETNASGFSA